MDPLLRKSIADAIFHGVNDECNLSHANCEMLADAAIERYMKAQPLGDATLSVRDLLTLAPLVAAQADLVDRAGNHARADLCFALEEQFRGEAAELRALHGRVELAAVLAAARESGVAP